jgi:hypothetical protein
MIFLNKGDGTFQAPLTTPFGTAAAPNKICVGDFNRDGKTDLAVADYYGAQIGIFLGNGDGTFQAPVLYASPYFPEDMAIGDFNGDGKPDLVIAGYWMVVMLGNGDGSFLPPQRFAPEIPPRYLAVGDFNGDGKLDLAITGDIGISVGYFICLGNGDGTFKTAVPYSLVPDSNYWAIAAADFNGDGKIDLVICNRANTGVVILIGRGDGTFQQTGSYLTDGTATYVAAADFNGDGVLDLAVADAAGVTVLTGRGDGTFLAAVNYVSGATGLLAVGDFNGDQRTDLAISGQTLNVMFGAQTVSTATALTSSANPSVAGQTVTFTATVTSLGLNGGPVAFGGVAFYDGASLLGNRSVSGGQAAFATSRLSPGVHVIRAQFTSGNAYVPSSATFSQTINGVPSAGFTALKYSAQTIYKSIAVADLNLDGKMDLMIPDYANGGVGIYPGLGDGTFPSVSRQGTYFGPSQVAVSDLNGDGLPDLAIGSDVQPGVLLYMNNGDGTFRSQPSLSGGPTTSLIAVDLNGDDRADFVSASPQYGRISVLLNNGNWTFQPAITYYSASQPFQLAYGDFNGDGKTDLVVINQLDNNVNILLGNGDGTFPSLGIYPACPQPSGVAVGDFNGDGRLDLAVSDSGGGVSVLLGNGDGTFQAATSYAAGSQPNAVAVGDVTGDGKADIVVANNAGGVSVLAGNGNGTFQAAVNYPAGTQLTSVAIADLNGDGRQDIASVGADGSITILLGKVPLTGAKMPASRVGLFRNGASFLEDSNGNAAYDAGTDRYLPSFTGPGGFVTGDMPVVGDWTGDGNSKVGIYRSSTGTWYLDANNNGVFDSGDYQYQFGGISGDIAFAGDWLGIGKSCVGIYRSNGSVWLLDLNCNGAFDNAPGDAFFPFGGIAGDVPVVGNWTGSGTRVGVVRKYAPAGVPQGNPFYWVLDNGAANAGTSAAAHQPDISRCFAFGGLAGMCSSPATGMGRESPAAPCSEADCGCWMRPYRGLRRRVMSLG